MNLMADSGAIWSTLIPLPRRRERTPTSWIMLLPEAPPGCSAVGLGGVDLHADLEAVQRGCASPGHGTCHHARHQLLPPHASQLLLLRELIRDGQALANIQDRGMLPEIQHIFHVVQRMQQEVVTPLLPVNGHGMIMRLCYAGFSLPAPARWKCPGLGNSAGSQRRLSDHPDRGPDRGTEVGGAAPAPAGGG